MYQLLMFTHLGMIRNTK